MMVTGFLKQPSGSLLCDDKLSYSPWPSLLSQRRVCVWFCRYVLEMLVIIAAGLNPFRKLLDSVIKIS